MKTTLHSIGLQGGPRTPETMFPLIAAKLASGIGVNEFCASHGLSEHIFYYGQRRHSEQRQDCGGFVEMEFNEIEMTAGQGWVPGF